MKPLPLVEGRHNLLSSKCADRRLVPILVLVFYFFMDVKKNISMRSSSKSKKPVSQGESWVKNTRLDC